MIGGSINSAHRIRSILYYEFKPSVVSPILLKEPNLILSEKIANAAISKEKERELDENEKKMEDFHADGGN